MSDTITGDQLSELQQQGEFQIVPFTEPLPPSGNPAHEKVDLPVREKTQFRSLLSKLPAGARKFVFPNGVHHSLAALKQNSVAMLRTADGALEKAKAIMLSGLATVSAVCGHFFLAEINKEMQLFGEKIDRISEFLYGDKKAELLAELTFARYASENYTSIMKFSEQRIATIASLQEAKKVAMKDIEFYLTDLNALSEEKTKNASELSDLVDRAGRIHDCITLSSQLFTMSSLLEAFYSQNTDSSYLFYVEESNAEYLNRCDKSAYSAWSTILYRAKEAVAKAPAKSPLKVPEFLKTISDRMDSLSLDRTSEARKRFHAILEDMTRQTELVFDENGDAYIKRIS